MRPEGPETENSRIRSVGTSFMMQWMPWSSCQNRCDMSDDGGMLWANSQRTQTVPRIYQINGGA